MGLGPEQLDGSPSEHFVGSARSHLFCGPQRRASTSTPCSLNVLSEHN
jgi:hypothetical protein